MHKCTALAHMKNRIGIYCTLGIQTTLVTRSGDRTCVLLVQCTGESENSGVAHCVHPIPPLLTARLCAAQHTLVPQHACEYT